MTGWRFKHTAGVFRFRRLGAHKAAAIARLASRFICYLEGQLELELLLPAELYALCHVDPVHRRRLAHLTCSRQHDGAALWTRVGLLVVMIPKQE